MGRRSSEYDEQTHPPGFAEALGRAIKVIRTDQGIERRQLAERAGISYSYLTEIENGNKPPSSSVLGPVAAALGLRMSQLIEAAEARMETQAELSAPVSLPEEWAREFGSSPQAHSADARLPSPVTSPGWNTSERLYAMEPSARSANRALRASVSELERLLRTMAPEDIERVLDFARRLAR